MQVGGNAAICETRGCVPHRAHFHFTRLGGNESTTGRLSSFLNTSAPRTLRFTKSTATTFLSGTSRSCYRLEGKYGEGRWPRKEAHPRKGRTPITYTCATRLKGTFWTHRKPLVHPTKRSCIWYKRRRTSGQIRRAPKG